MKTFTRIAGSIFLVLTLNQYYVKAQFLSRLKETVKSHVEDKTDDKTANTTDKAMDSVLDPSKKKNDNGSTTSNDSKGSSDKTGSSADGSVPTLKVYSNYDFVPGDKILFDDNFSDDQDGEFPAHWDLEKGQGIINVIDGVPAFCLTEGNYARVIPRMKTSSYLTDPFTVEFDYFVKDGGAYGINVFLKSSEDKEGIVTFGTRGGVSTGYFPRDFSADYPDKEMSDKDFFGKWHHGALIYKNNQLKCYVDQYRVLVIPSVNLTPTSLGFGGIGSNDDPIIFKNVRLASGGEMNMIGKKFTESKIVTHGINFDVDKATIKPESMGTLNMIVQIMKANPEIKFEVDGHTDNTGDAAHNLTLSQDRADAVKAQLVSMGIDASRLSTKGFGDTKPIGDNNTLEGKANNRRVEFVKM